MPPTHHILSALSCPLPLASKYFKNVRQHRAEICTARHLTALDALEEDPGLVSSTHTRGLITAYNSNPRGSYALSDLQGHLQTCGALSQTRTHKSYQALSRKSCHLPAVSYILLLQTVPSIPKNIPHLGKSPHFPVLVRPSLRSTGHLDSQPCVYTCVSVIYCSSPMISLPYVPVGYPYSLPCPFHLNSRMPFLSSQTPVTSEQGCLSQSFTLPVAALCSSVQKLHLIAIQA